MHINVTRELKSLFVDHSTRGTTNVASEAQWLAAIEDTRLLHSPANLVRAPLQGLQFCLRLPVVDRVEHRVAGAAGRSGALDAAIRSYEALGAKHGVDGVLLHGVDSGHAGIMFKDGSSWLSGRPKTQRMGKPENVAQLTDAARAVLRAVDVR